MNESMAARDRGEERDIQLINLVDVHSIYSICAGMVVKTVTMEVRRRSRNRLIE